MTTPNDNPKPTTLESLQAQASINAHLATAGLENLQSIIAVLSGTVERLEQENANLKSSLHEALELLQRCYDALDATGGHVDVQEDIDTLVYALRVDAETEGVPLERRYTARELMAMPRAQRYAILKKAADEAAEAGLYTETDETDEETE